MASLAPSQAPKSRSPEVEALSAFDRPFDVVGASAATVFFGLALLTMATLEEVSPAPLWLGLRGLAILASPPAAICAILLARLLGRPLGDIGWSWGGRLSFLALMLLCCMPAMIEINARCDHGPSRNVSFTILAKREVTDPIAYQAEIEIETAPTWPRADVGDIRGSDPIQLSYADYLRVVPGKTRIAIELHAGAFGLPWFNRRTYTLTSGVDPAGSAALPRIDGARN